MGAAISEFEMITCAGKAEHHSVEAVVIVKMTNPDKPEARPVHCIASGKIADGPGYPEMCVHSGDSLLLLINQI